ncbi:30S ribosomal protein S15, partial [Helicobacter pylori]
MALNLEKKQEIIKAFATKANDTGSCEV